MTRLMRIPGRPMTVRAGHPKVRVPFVADDFNRADSTDLGKTPLGALTWTKDSAPNISIKNGKLDFSTAASTGRILVDTAKTARRVSTRIVDVGTTPGNMAGGMIFWADSSGNYYYVAFRQNSTTAGVAIVSWTGTTTYYATAPNVVVPGDVVSVETTSAGTVTVLINGAPVMTASITASVTAFTRAGYLAHASGTAMKSDYFAVSDL